LIEIRGKTRESDAVDLKLSETESSDAIAKKNPEMERSW
jgi:hypothetical protein